MHMCPTARPTQRCMIHRRCLCTLARSTYRRIRIKAASKSRICRVTQHRCSITNNIGVHRGMCSPRMLASVTRHFGVRLRGARQARTQRGATGVTKMTGAAGGCWRLLCYTRRLRPCRHRRCGCRQSSSSAACSTSSTSPTFRHPPKSAPTRKRRRKCTRAQACCRRNLRPYRNSP